MTTEKTSSFRTAIMLGIGLCAMLFIASFVPPLSKGFEVQGFNQGTVKVFPSPAVRWEQVPTINKVLGYFFAILTIIGCLGVNSDWHEKVAVNSKGSRNWLAYLMIFGPVLISIIIFFASYSNSLAGGLGSKVLTTDQYSAIKDNPDALRNLFVH